MRILFCVFLVVLSTFACLAQTPIITNISPTSGPIGTTITISGEHLGIQPATVMIGNVALTLVSWADSTIEVTVPEETKSGYIWFQLSGNMVSGGQREGNNVWIASRPCDAEYRADDPPILTALNAGQATIRAGNSTATVDVYVGPELPDGTVEWSVPSVDSTGGERVLPAIRTIGATPAYLAVGSTSDGTQVLRGLSDEGRQLWLTNIGSDPMYGRSPARPLVLPNQTWPKHQIRI